MFGRSSTSTRTRDAHLEETDGRPAGATRSERVVEPDVATRQDVRKERFGGLNGGAAFFGWIVAIGVSVLLTGIVSAIAAAVGSQAQITQSQAQANVGTISIVAAVVLLAVLMIGYYCGGYVAGRMSRFSGGSQGLGVWITGFVVTLLMIALGAIFGQQYDILSRVNLPRLPVTADALSTGGVVAAIIVLVGTLLAAMAGGTVGTHYHRRVDKAGWNA